MSSSRRQHGRNAQQQRNVVLGACVPITVASAHSVELDLRTWAAEGLVDYLVPKRYQTEGCETFPNLDSFRKDVGGTVKVFGHYNDYNDTPRLKEAAAMSALLQEEKADGVHLFNVWNDTLGLADLKKKGLRQRLALMKPGETYTYRMTLGEDFSRFTPKTAFFSLRVPCDSGTAIKVTINDHALELADIQT